MSKFKDSMNRWVTRGLFKETAITTDEFVLMTLDEARKKYLACGDPTGYVFATEHLGGYKHWKALKNSPVLSPIALFRLMGWRLMLTKTLSLFCLNR